jgi:hypothetical protein
MFINYKMQLKVYAFFKDTKPFRANMGGGDGKALISQTLSFDRTDLI